MALEDIPLEGPGLVPVVVPASRYPSHPAFKAVVAPEPRPSAFALDERLFRECLAHISHASFGIFGLDLRYVLAGGETLSTLGLHDDAPVGVRVGELSGSQHILEPACERVLETGCEVFLRGVQMHAEWFDIDIFPIRRDGDVVGGVMVSRRITPGAK